jgi:hypothetical protein
MRRRRWRQLFSALLAQPRPLALTVQFTKFVFGAVFGAVFAAADLRIHFLFSLHLHALFFVTKNAAA